MANYSYTNNGINFTLQDNDVYQFPKISNADGSIKRGDIVPLINAVEIDWNGADLGTINGIEFGTINTTGDLLNAIKLLAQAINTTPTPIEKQDLTNFTVSMSGWTYGGTAKSPSVSGNTGNGEVTYKYKVSTDADSTYTSNKPTDAGTYTVQATVAETTNYYGATATANFTIAKATPNITVNNPASTTIADGGNTTIRITSGGVLGSLRFSSNNSTAAGGNDTPWTGAITPTSTPASSFDITITNNAAVIEQSTIAANGIKVNFTPSDTNNYNGVSDVNAIKQTITLSAAAPQTTYYYYAGWTLPTVSNVDTIITETYPAESGSSTMNIAGKKTTSKSTMDYTSNTLYNTNAKVTYYVLVPTGHAIYDSLNNNVSNSAFTSSGNIIVGNQTHTIYAYNSTSRNINAIIIK